MNLLTGKIREANATAHDIQRLKDMIPLLEEARDAITVISEAQRKLHGLSPTLATRMDEVGTRKNPYRDN